MLNPPETLPKIGPIYKQRGFGPDGDVIILKVRNERGLGVFVFFEYLNDTPVSPPQCASLAVFNSLFYTEPSSCETPPPENFISRIFSLKRWFFFIARR